MGRAAVVLCALASLLYPAMGGADPIGKLRTSNTALAASERAALLQLYAINSRLDRARGDVADAESRLSSARRRLGEARHQLAVARRTLALAQTNLGQQVRALYEADDVDAFAVILGSESLDDIITNLDALSRAARSTGSVIEQTNRAKRSTVRLLASLKRRASALARLRASAAARAGELSAAQSERSAYIGRLRNEQRLNAGRIAALEARARAAEAAATVATVKAQTANSLSPFESGSPAAQSSSEPAPAAPTPIQPASGSRTHLTVTATAYSLPGNTASGLPVGPGVVAVDPTVIPLGTRLYIPGYGEGIAADTGTAIKGLRIDLWFPTLQQAQQWGARSVTITVY